MASAGEGSLGAERVGERIRPIRSRPWPERPVSAANESGNDTAATRAAITYSRSLSGSQQFYDFMAGAAAMDGSASGRAERGLLH